MRSLAFVCGNRIKLHLQKLTVFLLKGTRIIPVRSASQESDCRGIPLTKAGFCLITNILCTECWSLPFFI